MKTLKIVIGCYFLLTAANLRAQNVDLKSAIAQINSYSDYHTGIKQKHSKMKASLKGIYISGNTLFFKMNLRNKSTISFDIDFVRFYIRDIKTAKRTVTQEQEMTPLASLGMGTKTVGGKDRKSLVFALNKFTLADSKTFVIEIYEKNGGRHLYLKIRNRDIENANQLININKTVRRKS